MSFSIKYGGGFVDGANRNMALFGGGDHTTSITNRGIYVGVAGVLSKFAVHTEDSTGTTRIVNINKNGSAGNQTVTLGSGLTGWFEDNTNTDTVAAGDVIKAEADTTSGNWVVAHCRIKLVPTSVHASVMSYYTANAPSATRYFPISGFGTDSSTESAIQTPMKLACTAKRLSAVLITNASGTATTVRSRKNTANGAQSVSITAGSTGRFTDVTNSDTLVAGDLFNYQVTGQNSNVTPTASMTFERADSKWELGITSGITRTASATVHYNDFGNNVPANNTSEALANFRFGNRVVTSNFRYKALTNTCTGAQTLQMRKNGVDANQSITVGIGATGWFEDAVNEDIYEATDDMCWSQVGGTSGSSQSRGVWLVCDEAPPPAGRTQVMMMG